MTCATLVLRNLGRRPGRTLLTLASVSLSLFLFVGLRAVVASMERVAADSAGQLRLVVHQKTTMTTLLPLRMGREIREMNGVRAVCGVRWFGGRIENSPEQFPSLAAETLSFPRVYSDFDLSADELEAWHRTRNAAVVGSGLARRMHWRPGQRVALRSTVPPYLTLEFQVIGVTEAAAYPNLFVLRLDYLLDALHEETETSADYDNAVNFFWVKADSSANLERVRTAIDARYAASPHATRTEPEEAFVAQFTKMFGDLPTIANAVGTIVIAAVLLVVLNTMSIAIRERTGELSLLKALGYSRRRIFALVLSESALLGLVGGLIGCLVPYLVFSRSASAGLRIPYFPVITISLATAVTGIGAGVLVGLLSGLAPAWRVARLPVTTALRSV